MPEDKVVFVEVTRNIKILKLLLGHTNDASAPPFSIGVIARNIV
jgi:hypothetical protein